MSSGASNLQKRQIGIQVSRQNLALGNCKGQKESEVSYFQVTTVGKI